MKISESIIEPLNSVEKPLIINTRFRFAFICTLLLLTAQFLESYLMPLNRWTANLSWKLLTLAGYPAVLNNDLITISSFTVRIVTECTPLYGVLLYVSFVLAHPAAMLHRLSGLLVGAAVITAVNTARIGVVTIIGDRYPLLFEIVHVYIGQVIMLLLVTGLAMLWQRRWKLSGDHLPFLVRAFIIATLLFIPWLLVNVKYVAMLDMVVSLIHSWIYPAYALDIPRPFTIYNHTFAVPFFVALMFASRKIELRQRIIGTAGGILVIAAWHTLFRASHVIWTAHHVESMEQILQAIYLIGQYLVPLLLWMRITGKDLLIKINGRVGTTVACLLLIQLAGISSAHALDQTITVSSTGIDSFLLRAENLQRVTEAEISISYENREQPAPHVSSSGLGAQTAMKTDTDSPGNLLIRMNSKKPVSGSGHLANIKLSGKISYMSGYFRGEDSSIITTFVIKNPTDEELGKGSATPRSIPVLAKTDMVGQAGGSTPAPAADEKQAKTVVLKKSSVIEYKPVESVLDRFHKMHATAGSEALTALVKAQPSTYSQQPRFALSDGKKSVKVLIKPSVAGDNYSQQFHIAGGRCISVKSIDNGSWEMEVVPQKGTLRTVITGLASSVMAEYPLLVAPPLDLFDGTKADKYLIDYVGMVNKLAAALKD